MSDGEASRAPALVDKLLALAAVTLRAAEQQEARDELIDSISVGSAIQQRCTSRIERVSCEVEIR